MSQKKPYLIAIFFHQSIVESDENNTMKLYNSRSVRGITKLFPFYVRYISLGSRKPIWNALISIESPTMRTRGQKIHL